MTTAPAPARRRFAAVVAALVVVVALSLASPSASALATTVVRYGGADRYATAAMVSASAFAPGVPVAFVATGTNFPDALAAGPAATRLGGPVLLVDRATVPTSTADELRRLRPGRIVVLGGAAAVSDGVAKALGAFSATVERWWGPDRYATAVAVSQRAFPGPVPVVYLVPGSTFEDALAAGAAAGVQGGALLLVGPNGLDAATAAELARLAPERVVVVATAGRLGDVGGAVAAAGVNDVATISGPDPVATSALVATMWPPVPTVYLATAAKYPDGLAGGAVAGPNGAPILLVSGTCLPDDVVAQLERLSPGKVVVLGGTQAVSASVAALTPCSAGAAPPTTPPPTTQPPATTPPTTQPPQGNGLVEVPADEAAVVSMTNADRAAEGRAALARNACLDAKADAWAQSMASSGSLVHNPNLGDLFGCPGATQLVGENIGYVMPCSAARMEELWMGSGGHHANIVNPTYTQIGVGVWRDPGGTCWYAVEFAG